MNHFIQNNHHRRQQVIFCSTMSLAICWRILHLDIPNHGEKLAGNNKYSMKKSFSRTYIIYLKQFYLKFYLKRDFSQSYTKLNSKLLEFLYREDYVREKKRKKTFLVLILFKNTNGSILFLVSLVHACKFS